MGNNTPTMIDEDELRAILAADAQRYDVPTSGADDLRTAIHAHVDVSDAAPLPAASWAQARTSRGPRRTTIALTSVAAAVILALLIGSLTSNRRDSSTASTADRSSSPETSSSAPPASASGGSELSAKGAPTTLAAGSNSASSDAAASQGRTATGAAASEAPTAKSQSTTPGAAKDLAGSEKIVKTGSIELEVPKRTFSDRISRLTSLAQGLGGFVAETSTNEQGTAPSGTITLRVPAERFENLLVQARKLGRVRSATTGAQDVTSEYTDITGRLKTMKDERDSLSLVLTDAKNVPDILAVRDRLNAVQAEIEQLEGRRKVLDDQTTLATLNVSLHEPGSTAPVPDPGQRSGLAQAWHDAVDGFTGGVEAIIAGSGKVLLVLVCAAGLWLLGVPVWRRFRRAIV